MLVGQYIYFIELLDGSVMGSNSFQAHDQD